MQAHKHDSKHRTKSLVTILIAAVLAVACGIFWWVRNSETSSHDTADTSDTRSHFIFDASKVPGWSAGDNIYPRADEAGKEDVPAITMIVHQGSADKAPDNCFMTYMYWDHPLAEDAVQAMELFSTKGTNLVMNREKTVPITTKTSKGSLAYDLYQYSLDGTYSGELKRGIEFGYAPVDGGYIEVRSYCNTASDLDQTLPAITAIRFQY